jgi:asparagine synthase (glutamine-hydrolysing)
MCGIAGWVGVGHPDLVLPGVRAAGRKQRHRGPDGEGLLVLSSRNEIRYRETDGGRVLIPETEPDLGLAVVIAHQRLAILDLSPTGAQPMSSRDHRIWLAYNGEIYNHVELRHELEAGGARFRGTSDTEVLLAAYQRWGLQCLDRLAGMFAFVIVDRAQRRIVLARDHLGQKPLYLRRAAGGLAFASEIPALLEIGGTGAKANLNPTLDYLATGRTDHRTDTMVAGVRRLDPGTAIQITGPTPAEHKERKFWSVPPEEHASRPDGVDDAAGTLRDLFEKSVKWHLRSDVPIGSLLSGGIDSSAIVLAQRQIGGPDLDLRAVSYIGTQGAPSEEPWIDMVTAASHCRVSKLHLGTEIWSDALATAHRQGEPMGSPAILVHHALCRHAGASGIKVLLDGQGADEILAGYPAAVPLRIAGLLRRGRVFEAGRVVAATTGGRHAGPLRGLMVLAQATRAVLGQREPLGRWPWIDLKSAVVRDAISPNERPLTVAAQVRRYLTNTLPAIMRWEDRNTMDASVEGRLPFLLPEVVAFCLSCPEAYLVGPRGENKYVLRRALWDLLPSAVADRRDKVGLAVPLRTWARVLPDVSRRLGHLAEVPGISSPWLRRHLASLREGQVPSGVDLFVIWRLVGFDLWREALGVDLSF